MLELLGSHLGTDVAAIAAQKFDDPNANLSIHVDGVRAAITDLEGAGQLAPLFRGFLELARPLLDPATRTSRSAAFTISSAAEGPRPHRRQPRGGGPSEGPRPRGGSLPQSGPD